jgi:PAS domain-containing protein
MAHHRHAYKETKAPPPGEDRPRDYSECGKWMWGGLRPVTVTCPKCNAIVAKRELAAHADLSFGQAIRDKEWLGYEYRSIWPLRHDGEIVGFATLENGWGKSWRICRVEADGTMGMDLGNRHSTKDRFPTKEHALLAVPQLVADGRLFAPKDSEAAVERAREKSRRDEAERRRQEDQRKRQEEELREAFESIADLPLSNMQHDAFAQVYNRVFRCDPPIRLKKAC